MAKNESTENVTITPPLEKQPVLPPVKIGLVNRRDCNIRVTLTSGTSIILSPKQRTGKEFIRANIASVNGRALDLASEDVMILN